MTRLGSSLEGQTATFIGMPEHGYLILSAKGDLSPKNAQGQKLGRVQQLEKSLTTGCVVAEGILINESVNAFAESNQIDECMALSGCVLQYFTNVSVFVHPPSHFGSTAGPSLMASNGGQCRALHSLHCSQPQAGRQASRGRGARVARSGA